MFDERMGTSPKNVGMGMDCPSVPIGDLTGMVGD